jgi:hypothetical protein
MRSWPVPTSSWSSRKAAAELAEALLSAEGAPNVDFYRQHVDGVTAEAEVTLAELRSGERMASLEQRVARLETALASPHARSVGIPDPARL